MSDSRPVGAPDRQQAVLDAIAQGVGGVPWLRALLVVGSMASKTADAVSDVDLIVVVNEGHFLDAWDQRDRLQATDAVRAWDQRPDPAAEVAAHRWLTPDLVLVEALVATASSGVRLAPPWLVLSGDSEIAHALVTRPPNERSEMAHAQTHPIEQAYDDFKQRIREAAG